MQAVVLTFIAGFAGRLGPALDAHYSPTDPEPEQEEGLEPGDMSRWRVFRSAIAVVALEVGVLPVCAAAQVAVIVNPANPISNVTVEELRRLYLGEARAFAGERRVLLVGHPPGRSVFYRTVLGMNEDRFARHWMGMLFSGEAVLPPKEIADAAELLNFVAANPGAIAFIDARLIDQTVKLVTVQRLHPSNPSYPLRGARADQ